MFNIPAHKRNANPKNTEISSYTNQKGYHQENKQLQMLVKMQVTK
jgi:hypothetical protein